MALTAKQQRFCDEYLITLNGSDASRLAGYKTRADQQAYENLRKPEIKSYIAVSYTHLTLPTNREV